jgi:hypothetical protein
VFAVLSLFVPSPLLAQAAVPEALSRLRPGQSVRVTTHDGRRREARFHTFSQAPPGLRLLEGPAPLAVAEIDSLWVRTTSVRTGAYVGALAAGIPSLGFWWWVCNEVGDGGGCVESEVVVGLSLAGAAVGAGLGALIGSSIPRWQLRYVRTRPDAGRNTPPGDEFRIGFTFSLY